MLRTGQDVFMSFAGGTNLRVLHPAQVVKRGDETVTIRYADPDGLPADPGPNATIFFDGPEEFMQQPGEFVEPEDAEGEPDACIVTVRLIGDPASAESRKCYRVGTVLADYTADFGKLGVCKLVDVSAAGVGFLRSRRLQLGDAVEIALTVGGKCSKGTGFIQSVKEVRDGYRYGLLCLEDRGHGGLAKGLQQLTMDAQRTQLRRLAGAA